MVVQANKTIELLDLGENEINDEGMVPLSGALKVSFVLFREISSFALLLLPSGNTTILGVWLYRRTARSLSSFCMSTTLGTQG